ncbi:hypothetical protein BCV69DRAFT_122824 [Microstroma glucosiphilum]|uniref:Uncharacterized protein n=1 Tax=Pseudomicrostroma glucosiphilum TaxID=1684307 RepID=A0A316U4H1_9BASI|nr:hypothetical protein BCV69DRAFT_122824 [Pseudomicrostroma glucosiphilum]PWN17815.1 hypothetical protein BCV69DRAFT_122824 [Pseudomicrostroma glucosiphilum]
MALGASAPSSSSAGSSRRRRPERRVMDVRVWYTLESSPHRMLAPLGRPTGIELLPPMRRSSNTTGEMSGATGSATQRFGKVTLKTCLSAICISSPELILDRKKDFILYVVDPEETYKATKRQRAHRASTTQTSPSVASGSRERDTSKDPNSIFVGRGFFGWVLEEEGDGDTVVVGKVSSERSDRSWDQSSDSDQEEEEDDVVEYLDVEIRMKETQAQSREQYFNMLKQFGGTTKSTSAAATPTSSGGAKRQPISASSPVRQRPTQQISQPGPSRSTTGLSAPTPNSQRSSSPIPPPQLPAQLPPGTTSAQQAQAMQLLALVQALQARQAQNQVNNLPTIAEGGQGARLNRSVSQPQFKSGAAVTPAFSRTFMLQLWTRGQNQGRLAHRHSQRGHQGTFSRGF